MADIKKFLDSAGVSTLWSAVATELTKKANADNVYTKAETDAAIADAAYNDAALKADIKANADAIAVLNGDSSKVGSVAYQIAEIVAGADEDFNTLKEIADWIAAHPESVADLESQITDNANAISGLAELVGTASVADQIASALQNSNLSQYAKASELADAILRIVANENAVAALQAKDAEMAEDIAEHEERLDAVEIKAANNETAIAQASARIDGLVAGGGEPNLINAIKVNGVVQAITDKAVDIAVPVVAALTVEEINAAIAAAAV